MQAAGGFCGLSPGAAILDLNGDEVLHGLLATMAAKQPYTLISQSVLIDPTVLQLLPTLL